MVDMENGDELEDSGCLKKLAECNDITGINWDTVPSAFVPEVKILLRKYKDVNEQLSKSRQENERVKTDLQNCDKRCVLLEDAIKNSKSGYEQKITELQRRLADYENYLKAAKEKTASMEAHHNAYLEETVAKTNFLISQMTKKLESIEKEKNDTVVRYAVREAEIMRLKAEKEKYEQEKKALLLETVNLKSSTEAEQLKKLEKNLDEKHNELILERKLQREKHAELQMALKRIEAGQTAINELRSSVEQLQKQLNRETEAKGILSEDYKKLLHQMKQTENEKNEELAISRKETKEKDQLYRNATDDLILLRKEKEEIKFELEESAKENRRLHATFEAVQKELEELKKNHEESLAKLLVLEDINTQVNSSLRRAEEAEESAKIAKSNMEQAELEASECRRQAERMLEVTEQLTGRNSALSSECETLREKCKLSQASLLEADTELAKVKKELEETQKNLAFLESSTSTEIDALKSALKTKTAEMEELQQKVEETNNEKEVIKKKNASFIKELRAELHSLRKKEASTSEKLLCDSQDADGLCLNAIGELTSSRASSVSSVDLNSRATSGSPPPSENGKSSVQQQMVEKIVKLQKMLARKQEKIEFLEEHIQQCTHELCKKTKIIQNYALREEASFLLPAEDNLNKVPLARRTNAVSLMGSMFSTGDRKTELELATEVNSRLQAVLEDTLHKNITLKTNLDTLGEEIARLSRENRQLALKKMKDS